MRKNKEKEGMEEKAKTRKIKNKTKAEINRHMRKKIYIYLGIARIQGKEQWLHFAGAAMKR